MKRISLRAVTVTTFLVACIAAVANTPFAQAQMPQFLFVQNAKGVVFEKGTITLKGVSPTTLFFSDRPMRIAGHLTTEEYIQMWGEGKDSFASDPPNATLSIFQDDKEKLIDVVVKIVFKLERSHGEPHDAGSAAGFAFSCAGDGYVDQKCRPQLGHTQNCWGGHGTPGNGSRRSIWVPHR